MSREGDVAAFGMGAGWVWVGGCISEASGGKSQRHLADLIEGTKRKTRVKGAAQIKGLSDGQGELAEAIWSLN